MLILEIISLNNYVMFCQKLCWFMFDFLLSIVTVFLFFFLFLLLTENDSNSSTRGAEASTGTQSFGAESNLWTCVHCTFINHPSKVVCEMCSLPQWIALSYSLTDWCFAGETATGTNDCKHPSSPSFSSLVHLYIECGSHLQETTS